MARMLHVYLLILVQIVALSFSPVVYGTDATTLINELPRSYSGEFQWRRSVRVYQVEITFTRLRILPSGLVEATGSGTYDEYGEISRVNLRAEINPDNLYMEMWEYEQRETAYAGMYRGDISTDMQSITAQWVNFLDKRRGEMRLVANP